MDIIPVKKKIDDLKADLLKLRNVLEKKSDIKVYQVYISDLITVEYTKQQSIKIEIKL